MPHDRFYIDAPLVNTLSLEGEEFHHLSRVMRKQEGEEIELVNGRHRLALARIESLQKSHAKLLILNVEEKSHYFLIWSLFKRFQSYQILS